MLTYQEIQAAAAKAEEVLGRADTAVVLGSGLGDYGETFDQISRIKYSDLPGFPASTAPGHAGELMSGTKGGKRVLIMNGRFHMYEGIDVRQIAMPIRVMINDYINLTGHSPLVGANMPEFGPRFPDMSHVFSRELQCICRQAAEQMGLNLQEGVYC